MVHVGVLEKYTVPQCAGSAVAPKHKTQLCFRCFTGDNVDSDLFWWRVAHVSSERNEELHPYHRKAKHVSSYDFL